MNCPARGNKLRINWWLLLIAPVVLAAAAVAANLLRFDLSSAGACAVWLEMIAPYMAATATAIYAVRAVVTRSPLFLMLTVLAAAMMCREIEWSHQGIMMILTRRGIYVVMGVVAVWMVLWRKKIADSLKDYRFASLLIAAMWTFFFSQLVARRIFSAKHLAIIPTKRPFTSFWKRLLRRQGTFFGLSAPSSALGGGGQREDLIQKYPDFAGIIKRLTDS